MEIGTRQDDEKQGLQMLGQAVTDALQGNTRPLLAVPTNEAIDQDGCEGGMLLSRMKVRDAGRLVGRQTVYYLPGSGTYLMHDTRCVRKEESPPHYRFSNTICQDTLGALAVKYPQHLEASVASLGQAIADLEQLTHQEDEPNVPPAGTEQ